MPFWAFLGTSVPGNERPKGWLDMHQGSLDAAFLTGSINVVSADRNGVRWTVLA